MRNNEQSVKFCIFDVSDFRRSRHVVNMRARSSLQFVEVFAITHGTRGGLTRNERSVALTQRSASFSPYVIQPARSAIAEKEHGRHRHPIEGGHLWPQIAVHCKRMQ